MEIELNYVARVVMVVVIALAAYHIGRWRGRDEGFATALLGVATKRIEIGTFEVDGIDVEDADMLEEILRSMEDDDDE